MVKSAQERLDGCHSTAADIATQQRQEFSEMELEVSDRHATMRCVPTISILVITAQSTQ